MIDEINSLLEETDEGLKERFLEKNNSCLNVKNDYNKVEYDYTWLEKIESTIEDLDQIVRNPKKFIIQEEEVVPIEKAKKITVESIRHLATHTNLIQDFDEKTGSITPSKILNINKEESYDIYENRFIYSLLLNLDMFLSKRKEITSGGSNCKINKKFNYDASTKIGNEKIKISLELETDYYEDLVGKNINGLALNERVERVELIISDFMKSSFVKELEAAHALVVKSPIRKTNVILKNTNFQKALELWEFIENYDVKDKNEINETKDYKDESILRETMDISFLMDYLILNQNLEDKKVNGIKKYYVRDIIRKFIENNENYDERKFKKLLNKEFSDYYKEKKKREERIEKTFKKSIEEYKNKNSQALRILK